MCRYFYLFNKISMAKQEASELRDRVKAFISSKGLSIRSFESSIGLPNGTVSQYSDSTSRETLKKISEVYTDFDIDYIISGRSKDVDINIYSDRQPILDIRVCAGNGIGLEGDENKITEWVSIPAFKGCRGIMVFGDSMYDKYKSGDIIFVRRIESRDDIDYGQCYVVITQEDRYIKNLYESSKGDGYITMVSYNMELNPDGRRKFPDRDIAKSEILFLYKVAGKLRRNQL